MLRVQARNYLTEIDFDIARMQEAIYSNCYMFGDFGSDKEIITISYGDIISGLHILHCLSSARLHHCGITEQEYK